ncbi:MAG: hypothetical protein CMO01_08510 [Thalassobius sp.]|nr:hypothetical protein [Thalassovita sp.]
MISTSSLFAQNKGNSHNKSANSSKHNTTQSSKQNTNNGGKTITIDSKSKNNSPAIKANKTQVNYRKSNPQVIAKRDDGSLKSVSHNNRSYYYDRGVFYNKNNNNMVKTAPPVGLRLNVLPSGFLTINFGNSAYFYFEGVYYERYGNEYVVAEPPVGAIVYALPADYEKVEIDGIVYYEYNSVLYSRIRINGELAYEVVGYLN